MKKKLLFHADDKKSADLFDAVDFDYPSTRKGKTFTFPVPITMSGDELTDILENAIKHDTDIKGDWEIK